MNKEIILEIHKRSLENNFSFTQNDISNIQSVIQQLDQGKIRVSELSLEVSAEVGSDKKWITNEWIKIAVLLFFKISNNKIIEISPSMNFYDKIETKKWTGQEGVRVVPPAVARYGSFVEPGAILMPSYINIGAYVGGGTMVDTWATVGSCAQIGKNVHLSGGVGIGGVLEPVQAQPVIIEDDCFLGSRCIVVEGVHLQKGVVLGAGVTITSSTKIIDVSQSTAVTHKGFVPENSVVIPGSEIKKFPAGDYGVNVALIIGKRKESTNKKTSLNEALRDYNVSV